MTKERSFKALVRARMAKTSESYTTARAALLANSGERLEPGADAPALVTSDAEILRRTGRGWEAWFDFLDDHGGAQLAHREISRLVADELAIEPLVWEAQAVSLSYERARGMRAVGQRADGSFTATASRTVNVPATEVFDAFVDDARRSRWLADVLLVERTVTRAKSARFDGPADSRVHVVLDAKGPAKTTITVEHSRLADANEAANMKTLWRAALVTLRDALEQGAARA